MLDLSSLIAYNIRIKKQVDLKKESEKEISENNKLFNNKAEDIDN